MPRKSFWQAQGEISRPIVALDIDGTLGDYHGHFHRFAQEWLGRELPPPYGYRSGSFPKYLGMSKSTYRQVKLAYRRGGLKRSMPAYPWSAEATRSLRKTGAEIWICTTRPYLSMEPIEQDTRHWLRRNGIQYDGLLFGEHKYRELRMRAGSSRIVGVLDDLVPMALQARECGMPAFVRAQPHNAVEALEEGFVVFSDIEIATKHFLNLIAEYKERHGLPARAS